jgi:hypothetical protein
MVDTGLNGETSLDPSLDHFSLGAVVDACDALNLHGGEPLFFVAGEGTVPHVNNKRLLAKGKAADSGDSF